MKEIVLMRGKEIVKRYPLTQENYILGRSKECDMVFDHAKVSRQHARISLQDGHYVLQDLNSTNYVFVNGTRIKQKKLEANDRIQVSSEILLLYLEGTPSIEPEVKSQTFVDVKGHFIHKDDLQRLKKVTRSVVLLNNLDAILMQILKEGIKLTRAERGLIVLCDKEQILWPYATTFRIDKEQAEAGEADVAHSILQEALQSKKSVVRFNEQAKNPEGQKDASESMMALKIFSAMCAPLVLEDRVIGLFYVDARQLMNNFTEVDQFLFDYLADHAAIAIFNAKRYADQRSQIEKLQVQLGRLQEEHRHLEREHAQCQGEAAAPKATKHSYSAGGVVLNSQDQILLVSQKGASWSLPKGRIEEGEEPAITAQREIYEESGVSYLRLIQSLGHYQRTALDDRGQENPAEVKTLYMYLFRTEQMNLAPRDPDNPEARWSSLQDAQELLTHPRDRQFLMDMAPQIQNCLKS